MKLVQGSRRSQSDPKAVLGRGLIVQQSNEPAVMLNATKTRDSARLSAFSMPAVRCTPCGPMTELLEGANVSHIESVPS